MYVKRDSGGRIVAVSARPEPGFEVEQLEPDDAGLEAFLVANIDHEADVSEKAERLRSSDVELIRVLEDIIDLLTDKGIVQFTELPDAARQKLLKRKSLRRHIRHQDLLDDDENDGMMP